MHKLWQVICTVPHDGYAGQHESCQLLDHLRGGTQGYLVFDSRCARCRLEAAYESLRHSIEGLLSGNAEAE